MLSDKDITTFQALYKEEFGTDISREAALEQGTQLVNLLSHVYKPMTADEYNEVSARRLATMPDLIKKIEND